MCFFFFQSLAPKQSLTDRTKLIAETIGLLCSHVCPGPEIDPFWYVGRGVRPIGRFGKRHNSMEVLSSEGRPTLVRMMEMLFNSLRDKKNLENILDDEGRDWLP